MFWDEDQVEKVHANKRPFKVEVHMVEPIYYSPYIKPIQVPKSFKEGSWKACNLTTKGFEMESLGGHAAQIMH